jgi:flagellar motor switch/type III secretory pathway protein FliN
MVDQAAEITGEEMVGRCSAALDEIAAALGRAFDEPPLAANVGDAIGYDVAQVLDGFDGPGVAVVLRAGHFGVLAILPESSGFVARESERSDDCGLGKLTILAQELARILMPDAAAGENCRACRVENIREAISLAGVAETAVHLPLQLKSGERQGQLSILWPVANPQGVGSSTLSASALPNDCPPHVRSLLRIEVPLSVQLAHQKQSVHEIISIVPGAIIKFEKSCDELLDLIVGDQTIAKGEVVKVGDKFGLRICSMVLPQEKFVAVQALGT